MFFKYTSGSNPAMLEGGGRGRGEENTPITSQDQCEAFLNLRTPNVQTKIFTTLFNVYTRHDYLANTER